MWLQPFPWRDTTKLCSGEGQEILVDGGAHGEVRSKTGNIKLFQQRDDGFAVLLPLEGPSGVFAGGRGTLARPDSGARTPELARPRHNSGLYELVVNLSVSLESVQDFPFTPRASLVSGPPRGGVGRGAWSTAAES